ncbi:DUF4256 domain-containing protein [Chitinophaga sp. CCNWYY40]|uniref:DUF4256 domain-containing protein n=1 Tax=unclassified Chitinophaga TaxID=2619133 RepID=UPI00403F166F
MPSPGEIRKPGGALFCDRRYDHVFLYSPVVKPSPSMPRFIGTFSRHVYSLKIAKHSRLVLWYKHFYESSHRT